MGTADSGSVAIATSEAVLPNNRCGQTLVFTWSADVRFRDGRQGKGLSLYDIGGVWKSMQATSRQAAKCRLGQVVIGLLFLV